MSQSGDGWVWVIAEPGMMFRVEVPAIIVWARVSSSVSISDFRSLVCSNKPEF